MAIPILRSQHLQSVAVAVAVAAAAAVGVVVVVAAYISRCWLDLWVMTKTKFCTFRAADKITETN